MHKLGLSKKVEAVLDPTVGYPVLMATETILQGEVIETCAAHDISIADSIRLHTMAKTFVNALQPNPIKLQEANTKAEELYQRLLKELLDVGNPTAEEIEKLREDPQIFELFEGFKWMDILIGNLPYYLQSNFPNSIVKWNEVTKLWQVCALKDINAKEKLSLQKKEAS